MLDPDNVEKRSTILTLILISVTNSSYHLANKAALFNRNPGVTTTFDILQQRHFEHGHLKQG